MDDPAVFIPVITLVGMFVAAFVLNSKGGNGGGRGKGSSGSSGRGKGSSGGGGTPPSN